MQEGQLLGEYIMKILIICMSHKQSSAKEVLKWWIPWWASNLFYCRKSTLLKKSIRFSSQISVKNWYLSQALGKSYLPSVNFLTSHLTIRKVLTFRTQLLLYSSLNQIKFPQWNSASLQAKHLTQQLIIHRVHCFQSITLFGEATRL